MVGYNLTPDTTLHKFMVMEGEGANGKSVVLELLEAMFGSENVFHVPLDAFGGRFQLVPTLNKPANIAPETNENVKFDEGLFKQVVAADTVYLDRKGLSGISAKPRRLILLPFRVTIPTAEQDRELAKKLKGELPGILNWALAGRLRLHKQRRFTNT